MKKIKVLRNYDALGHGVGRDGDEKEVSDETAAYLVAYDTTNPLVEVVEKKAKGKE